MGTLYEIRRIGPLMCVPLAQFSTFSQIARIAGIIDQTDGEEFAAVLKGGQGTDEVSEASIDLDHMGKINDYR